MIKHFSKILLLSIVTMNCTYAADKTLSSKATQPTPAQTTQDNQSSTKPNQNSEQLKYQAIIDEYKSYLSTVDQKTRDEVVKFRKEMININNQKKSLYKSLSQEAQLLLEKEKECKKKLPINKKKEIYPAA
jgi:hypothetical protein